MASKTKFELNLNGLNELMKSDYVESALLDAGSMVATQAGEDYAAEVHKASFVSISNVYATSIKEYYRNLKNNTLLKALSSSGLPMTKG